MSVRTKKNMVDDIFEKKIALFKYLSKEELGVVLAKFKKRTVEKDTILFKEGSQGDELFLIESGTVEVYLTRGEITILLAELKEPSFFGEMALLTEKTRSATVKTKTDCQFLVMKKQDLIDIYENNHRVAAKLLLAIGEILSERIINSNKNLENYFLINRAIVDNEEFRRLYILSHKAPSSSG